MVGELRSIAVKGKEVCYDNFGAGSAALILIHGWCCSSKLWRTNHSLFEKHRVILIDLPGFGSSDSSETGDYHLERLSEAVSAVIEHEAITTATLIGHSMGGPVATMTLRTIPKVIKAIIYVDSFFHLPESYLSTAQKNELSLKLSDDEWFRNRLQKFSTDKTPAAVFSEVIGTMTATSKYVRTHSVTSTIGFPLLRYDEVYDIPALHIVTPAYADFDRNWLLHIPRLETEVWADSGHFPFMEDSQRFNDEIERFVTKHGL